MRTWNMKWMGYSPLHYNQDPIYTIFYLLRGDYTLNPKPYILLLKEDPKYSRIPSFLKLKIYVR